MASMDPKVGLAVWGLVPEVGCRQGLMAATRASLQLSEEAHSPKEQSEAADHDRDEDDRRDSLLHGRSLARLSELHAQVSIAGFVSWRYGGPRVRR